MGLILGVVKTNMLSECLSITEKDIGTVYIAKTQKKECGLQRMRLPRRYAPRNDKKWVFHAMTEKGMLFAMTEERTLAMMWEKHFFTIPVKSL